MTWYARLAQHSPADRGQRVTRERRFGSGGAGARFGAVLVIFGVLAGIYNLATPIYEAHDETGHFGYVHSLLRERQLPTPGALRLYYDEYFQPPAYYLVAAAIVTLLPPYTYQTPVHNPYGFRGDALAGYNLVMHTDAEWRPYRGLTLALRGARLASTIFGAAQLLFTYLLARTIARSERLALSAVLIMALTPGFLFFSGVLNNDAGTAAFQSLVLLIVISALRRKQLRAIDSVGLGIAAGLAILSKITALGLPGFLALQTAYLSARFGRAGRNLLALMVMGGIAAALVSPWVIYSLARGRDIGIDPSYFASLSSLPRALPNSTLFFALLVPISLVLLGGIVLIRRWVSIGLIGLIGLIGVATLMTAPVGYFLFRAMRATPDPIGRIAGHIDHGFRTYWGVFGWGILSYDPLVYQIFAGFTLLASVGLLLALWRMRRDALTRDVVITFLAFAFWCAILVLIEHWSENLWSRYLRALVGPVSIALAVGLRELGRIRPLRFLPNTIAGGLGVIALATPFVVIRPAYALPTRYPAASALTIPHPIDARFGERIQLLGYELGQDRVAPGETIQLTLYERALMPMQRDYTLNISLGSPIPGQAEGIELLKTYPGRGMDQTSRWKTGEIIEDRYQLRIPDSAAGLRAWRLLVGFQDLSTPVRQRDDLGPLVPLTTIAVTRSAQPSVPTGAALAAPVSFGDQIQLLGATVSPEGSGAQIHLWWRALATPPADYTVFVHLTSDPFRPPVATGDSPPVRGTFPTSLWRSGDVIEDIHWLDLPSTTAPGDYVVVVGLYQPADGQRLIARSASAQLPANAEPLGRLTWTGATLRPIAPTE